MSAGQLLAQTIINDASTNSRAFMRVGIEPTTMIYFGFQRNVNVGVLNKKVTTFAEWGTSATRFGWSNSELKIGGLFILLERGSFHIVNNLNLSAGSNATHNFESNKFAFGIELAFGFYKKRWFFATTGEYEKIYLNRIEHTDYYRTIYYNAAKDGWYKGAGGLFQFGIEGGFTVKGRYDIHLEVKLPFTEKFNSYGGSPMHVNLGLGYRF